MFSIVPVLIQHTQDTTCYAPLLTTMLAKSRSQTEWASSPESRPPLMCPSIISPVWTLWRLRLWSEPSQARKEGRKEGGTPRLRSPREQGMGAPDNMPVEQTGRKTVYTKSGRKVQTPQRLDLWKSCTLTWLFVDVEFCLIWGATEAETFIQ